MKKPSEAPTCRKHVRRYRRNLNGKLRQHCQMILNSKIKEKESPHSLFVVTRSSLGKLWDNTIVVGRPSREFDEQSKRHGKISYSKVEYLGGRISQQWKASSRLNPFNLDQVHSNTLIVVTPITAEMLNMGITYVGRESVMFMDDDKTFYAVLLLSCLATETLLVEWPVDICSVLRKMKPNIVKPNLKGHFMSSGKCYAFGSGAKYGRNGVNKDVTIAPFTNKQNGENIALHSFNNN